MSVRNASREGHQAAPTVIRTATTTEIAAIDGFSGISASGAWSDRMIPAERGRAAIIPTPAPTTAPMRPSPAASTMISQRICVAVAPRSLIRARPRRRSVTFMSIALPTMNQAIATVSPVTKSRPRWAE